MAHKHAAASTLLVVLVLTLLVALVVPASAGPGRPGEPRFGPGAAGAGDAYFPYAGNGGYDVGHYDLRLRYTPPEASPAPLEGWLEGVATIELVATMDLDAFNLDLRGLRATKVVVNGKPMSFAQRQDDAARIWELTVTPRPKLKTGETASVVVFYAGKTTQPSDVEGALYGWVTTRDGAMVVNEPDGAMTWYPVSDHPLDKASYSFEIKVPEGKVAVANGLPARDPITKAGWTTWYWDAPDQQASYLSTASVGDYTLTTSRTTSGLPIVDAIDDGLTPSQRATTQASLARQPAMIEFFETIYGPYPFNSYGSIVDDDSVGYALETQTRPVYSRQASEGTVAHELAHQWLGNAVSPARWQDIWLNEGWATYSTWLWNEHRGIRTADAAFANVMARAATSSFWTTVVADPGFDNLFASAVYDRGAAALHALRGKVGDGAFWTATRQWIERYDHGAATTEDFQAVYENASGQDLDHFFDVWLRRPTKPTDW